MTKITAITRSIIINQFNVTEWQSCEEDTPIERTVKEVATKTATNEKRGLSVCRRLDSHDQETVFIAMSNGTKTLSSKFTVPFGLSHFIAEEVLLWLSRSVRS